MERPDPDALLAEVRQEGARQSRGKLKIFFGMSAGVGKTYAMLDEARKRAAEGVDVLVGYAEPHIRPDTEAILVALDILPYRLVPYRGSTLKEFDLDAAIARKPTICCVDELAHSNAPGMRHPKRWQDVAELLDAGINVYTTLNVQHLESVNDLVERITGVQVKETLPDAVFDSADEVELVDIAPDELLERFREGRIYRPEQAERASRHFFTKGNLTALRELALRRTAERVDEEVQAYRRTERLKQIVPASEKVLVCVGPSPLSARLIRSARRLSTSLRAKLIAVSVERPGVKRSEADQSRVNANLGLAEQLGAQTVTLAGHNVASEVLAYASANNVTKIVIGKSARPRWKDVLFGSVVDELIHRSGDIDIYVIRGDEGPRETDMPRERVSTPALRDWRGFAVALAAVALTTAIGWPLYHRFDIENENVLMLYLVGVMWVAVRHSRSAAIVSSLASVVAFDLMFVPPHYRLAVSDRQYILTFAIMLATALVISVLTHRVRDQANAARARERRTQAVLQLSRDLSIARTTVDIAAATARHVSEALGGRAAVLLPDSQQALQIATDSIGPAEALNDREISVAQWAREHGEPAGRSTATLPASAGLYVPLMDERGAVGVLALYPPAGMEGWTTHQRDLARAMAMQASVAMGRVLLSDEARSAWERVEAESLRNTLLSGISHELRTPLAGIIGSATALARVGVDRPMDTSERSEMIQTIISEGERLDRLITNLLDMSRLESGGLLLKREWTPIDEVIGTTLHRLERRLSGRAVQTSIADDLPLVSVDLAGIEQVLTNLIDNAVEYSPAGTPIEVQAKGDGDGILLSVSDRGSGLPAGTQRRIFDKFFRAQPSADRSRRGVGLGLAICRAIVEAHGGTIEAVNRMDGGATFRFRLPIVGEPPVVDSTQ